jgi:hypothetical protein
MFLSIQKYGLGTMCHYVVLLNKNQPRTSNKFVQIVLYFNHELNKICLI